MPVDGEFEVLRHDVGVDPPPAGGFETQSASIAFDLLALGDDDGIAEPLERRRALLKDAKC